MVHDTTVMTYEAVKAGKEVLFEGAQGTLLDLDMGTYPFVTSSHPVAGGCAIGSGVGPTAINEIMGIFKSYTTRVGEGPFPTELFDETGDYIRNAGGEFGTVTGRPRRVGWLDARAVRYAAGLSSFDYLAITRLDVLDGMDEIKICVGYEKDGQPVEEYPADLKYLEQLTPVYRTFKGWKQDISGIRKYEELPENARIYVEAIAQLTGVPIGIEGHLFFCRSKLYCMVH